MFLQAIDFKNLLVLSYKDTKKYWKNNGNFMHIRQ